MNPQQLLHPPMQRTRLNVIDLMTLALQEGEKEPPIYTLWIGRSIANGECLLIVGAEKFQLSVAFPENKLTAIMDLLNLPQETNEPTSI